MIDLEKTMLRILPQVLALFVIGQQAAALADEADDAKVVAFVQSINAASAAGDRDRMLAARDSVVSMGKLAVPKILEQLSSRNVENRRTAAYLVKAIGPLADEAVPQLVLMVKQDSDETTRAMALNALGVVGRARAAEIVPTLTAALEADNNIIRQEAIFSLSQFGLLAESAIPQLIARVRASETKNNKLLAIRGLPYIGQRSNEVLDFLIECLADESLSFSALDAISSFGPRAEPAVPAIIRLLNDEPFHNVNQAAAEALGEIGSVAKPAIPSLIAAMRDHNSIVCDNSASALGKIGAVTDEVVPALIKELSDPNSQCRAEAAVALGTIGRPAVAAIPELVKQLESDPESYLSGSCAQALGGIGVGSQPTVSALMKVLEGSSKNQARNRADAVSAVALIAKTYPEAIPELEKLGKHDDPWVRLWAAEGLAALGKSDEITLKTLIELLTTPEETGEMAATALGSLGKAARAAVPALLRVAQTKSGLHRMAAIEALGKISAGDEVVAQALAKMLDDKNSAVRFEAAAALARLGYMNSRVLAELSWHLKNSYRSDQAAIVLGECGPKARPVLDDLQAALKSATSLRGRERVVEAIRMVDVKE